MIAQSVYWLLPTKPSWTMKLRPATTIGTSAPTPAGEQSSACEPKHDAPDEHDPTPGCEIKEVDLLWR